MENDPICGRTEEEPVEEAEEGQWKKGGRERGILAIKTAASVKEKVTKFCKTAESPLVLL